MGLEIREMFGIFVGGLVVVALVATALNGSNKGVDMANAFLNGFANDIRAATFQSPSASG